MLSVLKVIFRPDAATCVFFGTIGVMIILLGLAINPPSSLHLLAKAEAIKATIAVSPPKLVREGWKVTVRSQSGS